MPHPTRFTRTLTAALLAATALLHAPAAQGTAVERLRAMDMSEALAELDSGQAVAAADRIECARLLMAMAPTGKNTIGSELAIHALTHALRLVRAAVPEAQRAEQRELRITIGEELSHLLDASAPPKSEAFKTRLLALRTARLARLASGERGTRALFDVNLAMIPMLVADKNNHSAVEVCKETLRGAITATERKTVRGWLGLALLRQKQSAEAVEFLGDYLARAPSDPKYVLPVVELLPRKLAAHILPFTQPVIAAAPKGVHREEWTKCLTIFYRCITPQSARQQAVASTLAPNTVAKKIPTQWGGAIWKPGYRTWRADGESAGKVGAGKQQLVAILPFSNGWRSSSKPPPELARWQNSAACFQRGSGGPTLAIYWFGPDLGYWWSTTPRNSGVTGKTVRGFNKGGISRLVANTAYGKDAARLGGRPRKTRSLPLKLGVGPGAIRKAWRVGDTIYDETFFSVGQVTIEVLLRVREQDLELLEPELEWLYRNIRIK